MVVWFIPVIAFAADVLLDVTTGRGILGWGSHLIVEPLTGTDPVAQGEQWLSDQFEQFGEMVSGGGGDASPDTGTDMSNYITWDDFTAFADQLTADLQKILDEFSASVSDAFAAVYQYVNNGFILFGIAMCVLFLVALLSSKHMIKSERRRR